MGPTSAQPEHTNRSEKDTRPLAGPYGAALPRRGTRHRHRPLVDEAVTAVLEGRSEAVHLDLPGLGFCDMTGLHALRRLTDRIHATGPALQLAGMHPRLHYALTLLKGMSPWTPPVFQG
ncbi:STAS domain-containing protein [Streptomyces sp. NPDC056069]|uniref:STAS domain-containing protein n=1 Tax=Streptomyces sp. NPDC056069 TaxID=3345702 RepID=UPI0035DC1209